MNQHTRQIPYTIDGHDFHSKSLDGIFREIREIIECKAEVEFRESISCTNSKPSFLKTNFRKFSP